MRVNVADFTQIAEELLSRMGVGLDGDIVKGLFDPIGESSLHKFDSQFPSGLFYQQIYI